MNSLDPILESALSVGGLTAYIQSLLEDDPRLHQVWVTGEVSSANPHPSGIFFTLQDPATQASIQAVVWRAQVARLTTSPAVGVQVIVLGQVQVYPARGQYRLVVWQLLPAGEGLLALRYRQLRQRLAAEGLFALERKRALPAHPQTIAVVTSPQAAAWGDIQRTLKQRYPGLRVLLSPAIVQGEQAPATIVAAIERVIQDGRAEVLILARGGGASEDLACFNDERVIRAVALCPIPVVAGIGHQRDESLADLAADVCAHTPTAAAEQAVPRWADLWAAHQRRWQALQQALQAAYLGEQGHLQQLRARLQRLQLDRTLQQHQQTTTWLRQRLVQATQQTYQQADQQCQHLQQRLQTLDPQAVLARGYAVVRQETGEIVRTTQSLTPAQSVVIQLATGQVRATITEILS
ncbi:exodeoxyribonuclease VII large subunit [Trichothermofontia sichuanensis B231]|uniref:exodeoxyribonuclease VII large subunit n=1 Tax=Trichothermofontia sichuanensis TaxID=3045816 RepID=UPI0022450DA3|nr:exodeoxyribonuclease VII large subunit [Trichothermofontia sichuanensis]UZQ54966.1 exodeoxyribonuclease VII large subunit [Trichothermofontia sichuanensis B231]